MNPELKKFIDEILKKTNESSAAFDAFMKLNNERIEELKAENAEFRDFMEEMQAKGKGPGRAKRPTEQDAQNSGEQWYDAKTQTAIRVLSHKERAQDLAPNKTGVSVKQWIAAKILGDRFEQTPELREAMKALATSPDASGGYTVPAPLSAEFIDLMRSALVLSRAGARYVAMPSKTLTIAKVVSDPIVSWKAENYPIDDSGPTFDAVTLTAKTLVGLVKFSLELSQDSVNIMEVLSGTLTRAMAATIDEAGLVGSVPSGGPTGVTSFAGRQRVTGIGTLTSYDPFIDAMGLLLAANVPLERINNAVIGTDVWTALAKLKTGLAGDKTALPRPPALANMQFLPTTGVPSSGGSPQDGTAFVADWTDLLYGVRQDITLHVLRETFLGSNLQLAILVYARVDFAAAREQSFVTLEGLST